MTSRILFETEYSRTLNITLCEITVIYKLTIQGGKYEYHRLYG